MTPAVFADSAFWIARLSRLDYLHEQAKRLATQSRNRRIVTSQMVLVEVLNNFSANGSHLRSNASRLVDDLKFAPSVEIVKQTPELFERATALYAARADKAWSLADCASFVIMTDMGIGEALTHDLHFEQAGFVAMIRG